MHGGPFANIAHGCNSVIATKMSSLLSEYTVTEAGFGADLGAEKFLDIKCKNAGIWPNAVVIVATVRALKYHGGVLTADLNEQNIYALETGFSNLDRHIKNIKKVYNLPVVVAINRFPTDTEQEINCLKEYLTKKNVPCAVSTAWADGGKGAVELAKAVCENLSEVSVPSHPYDENLSLREKITELATKIYGAKSVSFDITAKNKIKQFEQEGHGHLSPCIAKTQYSFSDNPKLLGAPKDFELTVRDVRLCSGAGFIVALCGTIMRMPGLPKVPSALNITITDDGTVSGLF